MLLVYLCTGDAPLRFAHSYNQFLLTVVVDILHLVIGNIAIDLPCLPVCYQVIFFPDETINLARFETPRPL